MIEEARNEGRKVHFASVTDLCHFKNSELEPQYQKYNGRVVLRGDIVKYDSGSYAVFTEQGSSASQMTTAKIMEITSRLPGCAGQAADAVSAHTQVKMEGAPKITETYEVRMSRYLDTSSETQMAKIMVQYGRSSCSSERNLYGHPLAGLLWERQFEKVLSEHGWEKVLNWECLFVNRAQGSFLSVYVDEKELAGKKQNIDPMWEVVMKQVDLGQPTSLLDHVFLGCTQLECQMSKDIVDNYRNMFESRIFAGAMEKLPETKATVKPDAGTISSWSYDMEGNAKKCVEKYCELAMKKN